MNRSFLGAALAVVALFAVAAPVLAQSGDRLPAAPPMTEARPAQPGMLVQPGMGCPQGGCMQGCGVQQGMYTSNNFRGNSMMQCGYSSGGCCDSCNTGGSSGGNGCCDSCCNSGGGRRFGRRNSGCCQQTSCCDPCCDSGRRRGFRRCCR